MNRVLILCVVLGCGTLFAQGSGKKVQVSDTDQNKCSDQSAISAAQQIVDAWKSGYNSGNAARVAALYAEDADYLTQHFVTGIVHGRASIQAYVQRGVDAGYRIDSLLIISVGCSGDMLYTVTRYEATNAGQKVFGVNLVVARRSGSDWRIVAHEAAVPDPATAIQHLDIPNSH